MNKAFNFSFYSSTTLLYYKDNNYEQKYILKTPQIRNPTKVSERCGPNRQECDFSSLD